jgi:two-component system cell cycle sensor histidine kinase/response regulator CckA
LIPLTTPGRYAVLSVSDTGTGMDAESRDRIFEPFFKTKGDGKGSGMGLAIADGIVKQLGGFIHVRTELGQGTLFRVYLPTIESTGQPAASETTKRPVSACRQPEDPVRSFSI